MYISVIEYCIYSKSIYLTSYNNIITKKSLAFLENRYRCASYITCCTNVRRAQVVFMNSKEFKLIKIKENRFFFVTYILFQSIHFNKIRA